MSLASLMDAQTHNFILLGLENYIEVLINQNKVSIEAF